MFKRQRKVAPYFATHPPFNAVTGQYASLTGELGVSPYCVLMQVAAEDTYADYVICRGFDTRILVFVDYEEGNPDKPGISVAKPYGKRTANTYEIGQIYPALLPIQGNATYTPPSPTEINLRLGQNPGVVDGDLETGGQPSDLTASLILLYDHNGIAVNWLMIDGGASGSNCEDLPDPGPYPATAGGSIAAGEVGPIVYDGTVYQVKNHSGCPVVLGDEVGFHVSPECETFFVPCVCSCTPEAPDCCNTPFVICVDGIIKFHNTSDTSTAPWSWWFLHTPRFGGPSPPTWPCEDTCDQGLSLGLRTSCADGVVTAHYTIICVKGGTAPTPPEDIIETSGTLDWSGLCSDPPEDITSVITFTGHNGPCSLTVKAATTLEGVSDCVPIPPNPELCCADQYWFCFNGESVLLDIDGDTHTWDMSSCCNDPDCVNPQLRIDTLCTDLDPYNFPRIVGFILHIVCDGIDRYTTGTLYANALSRWCFNTQGPATFEMNMQGTLLHDCSVAVKVSQDEQPCEGCYAEPPDCCTKFLWLCINGNSQQLSVNGGSYDFDVSACCVDCTTAELRVALSCNSELLNPLSLNWSYWCDGVWIDAGAINISAFCTSNDPVVYNFDALPCFLQLQVSIANLECGACGTSSVVDDLGGGVTATVL